MRGSGRYSQSSSSSSAGRYGFFCPPTGALESELLCYRDRVINPWALYRNQHLARAAMSLWYYLGEHYAEVDRAAIVGGVRGAILKLIDSEGFPQPTTNMVDPAVQQAVTAIVSRKWRATVPPNPKNNPRAREGARRAVDLVNNRLEQLGWDEKRVEHAVNYVVGGTGLIVTGWDRPYGEMMLIGSEGAKWCDRCSSRLYSPEIDVDLAKQGIEQQDGSFVPSLHLETADDVTDEDGTLDHTRLSLTHCPYCEDPTPLKDYGPDLMTPEEIEKGDDIYGRALGEQRPRGNSILEIDQLHEFYPPNGGARVSPTSMRRFARRKIRDLDWIGERYPDIADELSPDSPFDLLWNDPLLGQYGVLSNWQHTLDIGVLDNSKLVDEVVELPSFLHKMGRYYVCVDDRVLEDGPLLESATVKDVAGKEVEVYVPRIQVGAARFKIRPGEFYGSSLPEIGISPNNRLNSIDSALVEGRERMGPYISMPPGMWMTGPVIEKPGFGKVLVVKPDPQYPDITKPEYWAGPQVSADIYMERDRAQEDAKFLMSVNPLKSGLPVKNVGTTSGMAMLTQQDEEARSTSQDSLKRTVEQAFTHICDMHHVLRIDDEEIRVYEEDGSWRTEAYRGSALLGQTEVKIEVSPVIEGSIMDREAMREAIADEILVIKTPLERRQALRSYGTGAELDQQSCNQIDRAEESWSDFLDKGIVRVLDQIDSAELYFAVYGARLKSDEGQQLTTRVGWENIYREIVGWELDLTQITMAEQKSIQFYGTRFYTKDDAAKAYSQASVFYTKKLAVYQQQVAVNAAAGFSPPIPPIRPMMPMFNVPVLLQDRIFNIFMTILVKKGKAKLESGVWMLSDDMRPVPDKPDGYDDSQDQDDARDPKPAEVDPIIYIKFRALIEACRLTVNGIPNPAQPPAPTPGPELRPPTQPGSGEGVAPTDSGDGSPESVDGNGAATPPAPPTVASAGDGGKN